MISVSVGIPTFNEANNIANVLKDVLSQRQNGFRLKEVLVYDDGSTDQTVKRVKGVKSVFAGKASFKVKIVDGKVRKGKAYRMSQMFKDFRGKILLMFDGDIRLSGDQVIARMVESFNDPNVMLVGGNSSPFIPKSFFERGVYTTFLVFYKSRKLMNGGNNVFGCTGSILAIKDRFAKTVKIPKVINEDAYIYFECLNNGYKFRYQDKAVVYYKLPTNLKDYLRQLFRSTPEAVDIELKKYFGELVEKEFDRPVKFYFKSVFLTFLEHPLEVLYIVLINLLCKPFYPLISKNYKLNWFTAGSTH